MGIITPAIAAFVKQQKLGFVATVCPDGTPNLSPKGTTTVWDDEHLVFADIYSPGTVANLLLNPAIEINMVDIFVRKGYRFKGVGTVLSEGRLFDAILSFYRSAGAMYTIKNIVLITVKRILSITSPVYDTGLSEAQVIQRWREYWDTVYAGK